MPTQRRDAKPGEGSTATPKRRFEPLTAILLFLCAGLIAAIALLSIPRTAEKPAGDQDILTPTADASSAPAASTSEKAASPSPESPASGKATAGFPGFDRLKGRWLRPDGNYVIDVKNVDSKGKMEAGYFNPQPIHVAKAEATRDGELMKVFVELRDTHYPGCTYTLTYNPAEDQLQGVYFQASQRQNYDVVFVRLDAK